MYLMVVEEIDDKHLPSGKASVGGSKHSRFLSRMDLVHVPSRRIVRDTSAKMSFVRKSPSRFLCRKIARGSSDGASNTATG